MEVIKNFWPVILLFFSNAFMVFAWYEHLGHANWWLLTAILVSWVIALPEYCLHVWAHRLLIDKMSLVHLKVTQEGIHLFIFMLYMVFRRGIAIKWNYVVAFILIAVAVALVFKDNLSLETK